MQSVLLDALARDRRDHRVTVAVHHQRLFVVHLRHEGRQLVSLRKCRRRHGGDALGEGWFRVDVTLRLICHTAQLRLLFLRSKTIKGKT